MSTIGDYYADKDAEARRLADELAQARKENKPWKEIRKLEILLERARYVGD